MYYEIFFTFEIISKNLKLSFFYFNCLSFSYIPFLPRFRTLVQNQPSRCHPEKGKTVISKTALQTPRLEV